MDLNATSADIITLDTRTPPKIKQHAKKKNKPPTDIETSHVGIAIPITEDEIALEESTKKLTFYKVEKPTTNSGLSTWILLSGQTTPKPSRKPVVKPNENTTLVVEPNKAIKPIFKKRISTTSTTSTSTVTTPTPTTTKLIKIKASVLNNAVNKKESSTPSTTTTKAVTVTTRTTTTTPASNSTTTTPSSNSTTTSDSSALPAEAKEGETEIEDNKKRRPTNKRKKNKNRRRRPSEKNSDDTTKVDKPAKSKEKPISTQFYNYLSREVMPTVGVGLVGLMVTAGLASYFLYPFGAARRSYEIDRKDKDAHYYYTDDYSGGIAEEEAIGKVIAGMPSNSLYGNTFKTPSSRHSFNNLNNHRVIEQSTGYTVSNEEITPAAVPEHGPRRRRAVPVGDDQENEIGDDPPTTTFKIETWTQSTTSTTTEPEDKVSLFDMFKELFHLKLHLGLQLIQNATQAVSKYVSHVQRRLDERYSKNYTLV